MPPVPGGGAPLRRLNTGLGDEGPPVGGGGGGDSTPASVCHAANTPPYEVAASAGCPAGNVCMATRDWGRADGTQRAACQPVLGEKCHLHVGNETYPQGGPPGSERAAMVEDAESVAHIRSNYDTIEKPGSTVLGSTAF